MIRVEVLDSSPIYLYGLAHTLPRDGIEIIGMRSAPREELTSAADVYLMDASTLDLLGKKALRYVAGMARLCRVLILTPTRKALVPIYLEFGAVGFVSKQEDAETLVRVIEDTADLMAAPADSSGEDAVRAKSNLSGREAQVLQYIASGYTHGQVARRLGISPHTVDTYVKRIRAKLAVGNKAELTCVAVLGGHLQRPA